MCNRYLQGTNYSGVTNCANFGTQGDKWPDPIWTGAAAVDGGLFQANWVWYQYWNLTYETWHINWNVTYAYEITQQRFNTDWSNLNSSGSSRCRPISGPLGRISILLLRLVPYVHIQRTNYFSKVADWSNFNGNGSSIRWRPISGQLGLISTLFTEICAICVYLDNKLLVAGYKLI